jgi:uncharacterized membrane protein YeaQ/YmgE (transglycosylase-associated protein family)
MGIIAWIFLGLLAGAIAKAIYPGTQGGGILTTMILGIIGAFVGGTLAVFFETGKLQLAAASLTFPGVFMAVLGAIIVIFLWGLISRKAT